MGLLEIECMMDPDVPAIDSMNDIAHNTTPVSNALELYDYKVSIDLKSEAILASLPLAIAS